MNCLRIVFVLLSISLSLRAEVHHAKVLTGIDVLEAEAFSRLNGLRVGLITNHAGRNRAGKSTVEVFHEAPGVRLERLFSPEHGLYGDVDRKVASFVDPNTGLTVHSLYGQTRRPTPEMLEGLDALVFDIQDIGARFYTYISTMGYAMEEAAKAGIRFMVLDRPNPINGVQVEGPILESHRLSFTGYFPLPVRHGMTVGELAMLFNEENQIGAKLEVVRLEGWQRSMWLDETDLSWMNPSPNIRNLRQATLYTAVGLLESTNLSVGRGTDTPFEILGAPWINASRLARTLRNRKLPGVKITPAHFTPTADRYEGKRCHGVRVEVTDRTRFRSVAAGLEMARAIARLYPRRFQLEKLVGMTGSETVVKGIQRGDSVARIVEAGHEELEMFMQMRQKYLLYP
ncbi:MAG TPA: DUF1343 domain-containing protein [Terriglobia bacterium]|nr:DUF1343 domain-containing protein [Terriglobia bacterium]